MDRLLKAVPPPLDDEEGYVTVAMLCERWHCSPNTVRHNWRKWKLNGTKFGKRLLFTFESVEAAERRRAAAGKRG